MFCVAIKGDPFTTGGTCEHHFFKKNSRYVQSLHIFCVNPCWESQIPFARDYRATDDN